MASPAEVANDLAIRSAARNLAHVADTQAAMYRGARTIRELLKKVAELEAAADAEAQRFEDYKNGEDLHGH